MWQPNSRSNTVTHAKPTTRKLQRIGRRTTELFDAVLALPSCPPQSRLEYFAASTHSHHTDRWHDASGGHFHYLSVLSSLLFLRPERFQRSLGNRSGSRQRLASDSALVRLSAAAHRPQRGCDGQPYPHLWGKELQYRYPADLGFPVFFPFKR